MDRPGDDLSDWMTAFRWIVKLIRDDYGVEERRLVRAARLEGDLGLEIEQLEQILDLIAKRFSIRFPESALDEIVALEELCAATCWINGLYRRPDFISEDFGERCIACNPGMARTQATS